MRLETDNIQDVYDEIKAEYPELLHPNGKEVTLKPWGAKEFALRDESGVSIIIQQWNK
jgi:predicted HAD superfamily hydrolase